MLSSTLLVVSSLVVGQAEEPTSNYEHLKGLQSFIGTWEAKGTLPEGEGEFSGREYDVRISCRWAVGRNAQAIESNIKLGEVTNCPSSANATFASPDAERRLSGLLFGEES